MKRSCYKSLVNYLIVSLFVFTLSSGSVQAGFDTIYFSSNGDTTATTMIQGDDIGFGSNCELGATMLWEAWFDFNGNSSIDATDGLILSEIFTDGLIASEGESTADGALFIGTFNFFPEPGNIILRTTELATDSSLQLVVAVSAMISPPNQFNGQISLPGITPPNALLANSLVSAESETGDEGDAIAITDINGNFTLNIGALGNGVEFFIEAQDFDGYVSPGFVSAIASGVVNGNDFIFDTAVDSVYGFVKDEFGVLIPYETDISAMSGSLEKYTTTKNGRYVIYFSNVQKGNWHLRNDSRNMPLFLEPQGLNFSHDSLTSFQYDIILRSTNAFVYAKITENGGFPSTNYAIQAFSQSLSMSGEAVADIGANNIVAIPVSTADASGWNIQIINWDEDFPIPAGLVASSVSNVSIGDTVILNLISGHSISGTMTQDVGDSPINWDFVWVGSGPGGTNVNFDGTFEYFTSNGFQSIFPFLNGYITNPQFRDINVSGSAITGIDFVVNESHSTVSGTLVNVSLPLDASWYTVTAQTGSDGSNGYMVFANVDSVTGTYTMNLCDGNWTLIPPCCLLGVDDAGNTNVTIGEAPADLSKTVDFTYGSQSCCTGLRGNANGDLSDNFDISDLVFLVAFTFQGGAAPPCIEEADFDGSGVLDISDLVKFVGFVFQGGAAPEPCP